MLRPARREPNQGATRPTTKEKAHLKASRPLFRIVELLVLVASIGVLAVMPRSPIVQQAEAATPNVSVGGGQVMVFPFHISGQYTATTAAVVKFAMPQPCTLIGAGATARASGGTTPTLTVDVLEGGTTVLSAPISITAGTYSEGTITDSAIADEATVTVNLTIGGTSPTWNDITVVLTCARR